MKNKFMVIILALGMMFGSLALATTFASPASAVNFDCVNKVDRKGHTFAGDIDVFVNNSVLYKYCTYPGKDPYVKPYRVINTYDVEGSRIECNQFLRRLDGVTYNWYFWRPDTGANFNPGGVSATCDESSMNTVSQSWNLADVPRFYFARVLYDPAWKVNVELEVNAGTNKHWAHAQPFNP